MGRDGDNSRHGSALLGLPYSPGDEPRETGQRLACFGREERVLPSFKEPWYVTGSSAQSMQKSYWQGFSFFLEFLLSVCYKVNYKLGSSTPSTCLDSRLQNNFTLVLGC